jgi:nitrate reductase assembly molybdenum cofactor insertion protein NarJ
MSCTIKKVPLPEPAWATLFDAFSVAFSYPTVSLYQALKNGDFYYVINEEVQVLHDLTGIKPELDGLQRVIEQVMEKADLRELEADYISLFEVNRTRQVLHMYAYLYSSENKDRVTNLQRLQKIYHQYGLVVASGKESESPDHLVVQLEFLSYLFTQLAEACEKQQVDDIALYREAIGRFITELTWIDGFLQAFSETLPRSEMGSTGYSLYLSLVKVLSVFVSNVHQQYSIEK